MVKSETKENSEQRTVVKKSSNTNIGVEQSNLARYAIGYILKGERILQQGDKSTNITKGSIFFLGLGVHYIEDIPAENAPFEQLVFYYTPDSLQRAIVNLSTETLKNHNTNETRRQAAIQTTSVVNNQPNKLLQNFFIGVNSHLENGGFSLNKEFERLKLTELAHLILHHGSTELKCAMMESLDCERAEFERIIYSNILVDRNISELASLAGRSVTSFKQFFKTLFGMPPHRWYLQRRLEHAQLLLSTTKEPIAQIGALAAFPNTSHFIKLFKRQYGMTPATYRHQALAASQAEPTELEELRAGEERAIGA